MARFFRLSLALAAAGLFLANTATANIPDPTLSNVPDMITITPDGSAAYTVTINGPQGPVNGANVEIQITGVADALVCWCAGQIHPNLSATTAPDGTASFFIAGGGCILESALSGGSLVARVFADGILMAQPEINSPDVVNRSGDLYTDTGFVFDPACEVGLADASFHTGPIVNGLSEKCTNFSDPFDDAVGLGDAVFVTDYIVAGTSCTP